MNKSLSRRLKMLRMLSAGKSIKVVAQTLSKENNCTLKMIYHDYANRHIWASLVEKDNQSTSILRTRLDHMKSEALLLTKEKDADQQLNTKDHSEKIVALKSSLNGMIERVGLARELRAVNSKPPELCENLSVATPFESDPVLKQALLESVTKQKEEKGCRDAAKGSDATRR